MMRTATATRGLHSAITLGAIFSFVCLAAHAQKAPPKADAFTPLIAKVKAGDVSVDFTALRMASPESDAEDAGAEADLEVYKKGVAAFNAKKFDDAVLAGERALKSGYLDADTHLLLAVANQKLGKTAKFEFHRAVYRGLINSILKSGDGKSSKTAYVVIAVREEYAVLNSLGLTRDSQAVRNEDGHTFDLLTATDEDSGKTVEVWFNIDIVWKGYEKVFKK